MAYALTQSDQPIADLNTTPLIDVLLVLLVMFLITLPIQTHAVKLDLPGGPPPLEVNHLRNTIAVTAAGDVQWNATSVSLEQLSRQLAAVAAMDNQPQVELIPQPDARYALVDEILVMTKRARVNRLGFVGNERYAHF